MQFYNAGDTSDKGRGSLTSMVNSSLYTHPGIALVLLDTVSS